MVGKVGRQHSSAPLGRRGSVGVAPTSKPEELAIYGSASNLPADALSELRAHAQSFADAVHAASSPVDAETKRVPRLRPADHAVDSMRVGHADLWRMGWNVSGPRYRVIMLAKPPQSYSIEPPELPAVTALPMPTRRISCYEGLVR